MYNLFGKAVYSSYWTQPTFSTTMPSNPPPPLFLPKNKTKKQNKYSTLSLSNDSTYPVRCKTCWELENMFQLLLC